MTIMASASVPSQYRLDEAKTVRLYPMHDQADRELVVIEHEGTRLRVVSVEQHDARCSVRVASAQGTTPEVLHCHFCGFAYWADEVKNANVPPARPAVATADAALDCRPWCVQDHSQHPDVPLHQSAMVQFTARDAGAYDAPGTAAVWVEYSEGDAAPDEPDGARLVLTLRDGPQGGYPLEANTTAWTGTPEQAEALARELLRAASIVRADAGTRP